MRSYLLMIDLNVYALNVLSEITSFDNEFKPILCFHFNQSHGVFL